MTTKEKIIQYLSFKGISPTKAETMLKWGKGALTKSSSISIDKLEEFLLLFDDLSSEWLMRGEGNMLKSPHQEIGNIANSTSIGNNLNGNNNNISSNSSMEHLQREYLDMLRKKDEQIDVLLKIIAEK